MALNYSWSLGHPHRRETSPVFNLCKKFYIESELCKHQVLHREGRPHRLWEYGKLFHSKGVSGLRSFFRKKWPFFAKTSPASRLLLRSFEIKLKECSGFFDSSKPPFTRNNTCFEKVISKKGVCGRGETVFSEQKASRKKPWWIH